jgi:ubiquinol-cytochrome c reductase cytochrome c1 subunit
VEEGKAYNPYFPNGSVLAMPQQLFDEGIEYKDGTPATMTQQAKDVATVCSDCLVKFYVYVNIFSSYGGLANSGMIHANNGS